MEPTNSVALLKEGDDLLFSAHHGPIPMRSQKRSINRRWTAGRAFIDKKPIHVHDLQAEWDEFSEGMEMARDMGHRSIVSVPLLREGESVGALVLRRLEVNPFSEKQIVLLQTFADQAVIAIENARLFNETQEALERQTATADVLKVIASSPSDVQPVFEAIVQAGLKLFPGSTVMIVLANEGVVRVAAIADVEPRLAELLRNAFPSPLTREYMHAVAIMDRRLVDVPDAEKGPAEFTSGLSLFLSTDHRAITIMPLLRGAEAIGALSVVRRLAGPLSDRQMELLKTFSDQAVIAIENTRLLSELRHRTADLSEALERQTATADVLNVIGRSPTDAAPVFDVIGERAEKLCDAEISVVSVLDNDLIKLAGIRGISRDGVELFRAQFPLRLDRQTVTSRTINSGKIVHVADVLADPTYDNKTLAAQTGYRSCLGVPMHNKGQVIGAIFVARTEPGPFTDNQIQLLQIFADQAVIAIENVRLFNETQEALERQTATADILKVIASSPSDTAPVFDAIAESAKRLLGSYTAMVTRVIDGVVHLAASTAENEATVGLLPYSLESDRIHARVARTGQVVATADIDAATHVPPEVKEFARTVGWRSMMVVPMLRNGVAIGTIGITRRETGAFDDKTVGLLKTFADQAVIAIENTRLFNETKEALEQQTATSEVLEIISSSPGELDPVFNKMLENATLVCGANFGVMHLIDGDSVVVAADYNLPASYKSSREGLQIHPHPESGLAEVIRTHEISHMIDLREGPAYRAGAAHAIRLADVAGARTIVVVPMLKENELIGTITIFRQEVRPFTDKQIALVKNFTKQAVIAIENTRLLRELRERTNDLSESLRQQTATSEVLRVISSSSGDLQPVFKAMLANALKICDATYGNMMLWSGDGFRAAELHNSPSEFAELFKHGPLVPPPGTALGRVVATKQVVLIPDILAESGGVQQTPLRVVTVESMRARTLLAVPMLRESELVGVIVIYRQEVRPFNEKQIELVANFADQAVIAIENARLLNELRMRTTDLSLSLDNLRAAQDRLVQTEKLASLGQLTAGIAHEIKNPLNFVNNFSALSAELTDELNDLLKEAALTDKMRGEVEELTQLLHDNLEKVVQHGKRANSIVRNMLLHSREGSGEQRSVDINALVEESLNLAYHGARAEKSGFDIKLEREFDVGAGAADLFPQEITRALLNLISNGFYAATKRSSENGEPAFEPTLRATTKNLGTTVEIRIRDNGAGIPLEVREKMFNPFFTTKPAGEGTGLGLSMTHDIIVKQHGGRIDVATKPGQFAEFIIVLPRKSIVSDRERGET